MVDYNLSELANPVGNEILSPDAIGYSPDAFPNEGATVHYRMRALADPGPGYVHWNSVGSPDFAGSGAGDPIQAGTVVQVGSWME